VVPGVSKVHGAIICNYSAWTSQSLKAKVLLSFETSETIYPTTQRHIIKDLGPAPHRCENLLLHFKETLSCNSSPCTLVMGRKHIAVRDGADFSQSIVLPRDGFEGWLCSAVMLFYWRNSPPPPVGQGLLIHEVSRSHTTTHHSWQDSSGRVIGPPQRPLPNNTQHRQQSMPPVGFEPTISASERPQTYTLEPRPRTPCSAVLIVNILPLTYPQLNVNSV